MFFQRKHFIPFERGKHGKAAQTGAFGENRVILRYSDIINIRIL